MTTIDHKTDPPSLLPIRMLPPEIHSIEKTPHRISIATLAPHTGGQGQCRGVAIKRHVVIAELTSQ